MKQAIDNKKIEPVRHNFSINLGITKPNYLLFYYQRYFIISVSKMGPVMFYWFQFVHCIIAIASGLSPHKLQRIDLSLRGSIQHSLM